MSGEQIAAQILEIDNWPNFDGYGILPGIESAEFDPKTPENVGTRIRVTNRDGSSHVEEIVEWEPETRLRLRFGDFSPPVSRLATAFEETWEFESTTEGTTRIVRSFRMDPKSVFTRPVLVLISFFLKRAISRHLKQIGDES